MSRALGIDLGSRRIGIAVSDPKGSLATPYAVLHRTSDEHDTRAILEIMNAEDAKEIVLGMPLSLDGSKGDAALVAESFGEKLKAAGARVRLWDERFSTMEADKLLKGRGMSARQRRAVVDKTAATLILQAYLDTRRKAPSRPAATPSTRLPVKGSAAGRGKRKAVRGKATAKRAPAKRATTKRVKPATRGKRK